MDCTPESLVSNSKCFACLSEKQLLAISNYLLCQIVQNQASQPKVFRAILFDPPTPMIVLENTLGFTPQFLTGSAATAVGGSATYYYLYFNSTSAFPISKTMVLLQQGFNDPDGGIDINAYCGALSGKGIEMQIRSPQIGQDWTWQAITGEIENLYIEVRRYP